MIEKDEFAARHFIGVVAAIKHQSSNELRLLISDGHYALWSTPVKLTEVETSDSKIY